MSLPAADPDARAHSAALQSLIAHEIAAAGGWISFARYMELVLYAPGLGYYSAGAQKLGPDGDFTTAPEISRLFGRTLARYFAETLSEHAPDILELGAGSGKLARDVLDELDRLGRSPRRYWILEPSASLRARQRELLAGHSPRVEWLDALPSEFAGVIFGNEVLDALPVELVHWYPDRTSRRGVELEHGALKFAERLITEGALNDQADVIRGELGGYLERGDYRSEIGLAAQALTRSLASILKRGLLLWIDYGFERPAFYHPQRRDGTLMCHYRHHAHGDPFYLPGLQDITAHVDFSAIDAAARAGGLDAALYTTQARFLLANGILELLAETDANDAVRYLPLANQVSRLTSPAEMGELFKVIAWTR